MLYIDGNAVVNNNFFQGPTQRTGLVNLTPGLHAIDVEFYNGGGGAAMEAQWDPTGGTNFVDIPNFASGGGSVIKTGTGTTILSGDNTYTGTTLVNGGTLQVDGSIATSFGVTVASGATLSGTGTVSATTVNGTLQPGDPGQAGTLNTDLSFGAGSTLKINENNSVCSEVNVTGTASLTGASLSLTFADVVTVGSTYTIVHTTGGLGGTTFNGLPDGSTLNDTSGQTFQVNYTATDVILTKVTSTGTAPTVTGVVINQDIAALYNAAGQPFAGAQRSMVNDVVYTFSEPVNIVSSGTDPNVFTIAVASGFTGTPPTLNWAPVTGSGNTQWAVSFSGSSVSGGSIANGAYDITINVPSEITAVSDSLPLTVTPGTAPAPGNPGYATQEFYRLYGDINGDKFVNAADNSKFKLALATYNQAFDYNGDGFVNAFDNGKFKNELTVNFSGFTPTI
jgi:autotransporter-associated beta strand protein